MGVQSGSVDVVVAELAGRQHGVVARRQLLALGIGRQAIARRRERGALHPVHRGVYAVGHAALTLRGRWMAAALAAGLHAVLSHRAAAALWGLRGGTTLEVTAPDDVKRRGVIAHRAHVPFDECTVRDGIPVTTVARTLLDLAAILPPDQLERAMRKAEYLQLTDTVPLDALVVRYPNRKGVGHIRRIAGIPRLGADRINSTLEERFHAWLTTTDLPRPIANGTVLGCECDAVWPDQRVVVEVDGPGHATPLQRAEDARRDRALTIAGWRPMRVTEGQLEWELDALEADLRGVLC